ncbi:MAG: EAL domain-containing protein [Candidatus Izemoplasmatales bacterium]
MRTTVKVKQNSLSRRIVSLTVFLDALFLVLIMAVLAFIFISSSRQNKMDTAMSSSEATVSAIQAFYDETFSMIDSLSKDQDIIDYLTYLSSASSPIVTNPSDSHYVLYENFMSKLDSMSHYNNGGIYDFVFVASENACSSGSDGCYIGSDEHYSDASWNLSQRPWFIDLGEKNAVVSHPYLDSLTSEMTITFVMKVYDGENLIGYIGMDVWVSSIASAVNLYDYTSDQAGKYIVITEMNNEQSVILYFSNENYPLYTLANTSQFDTIDSNYGFQNGMASLLNDSINSSIVEISTLGDTYFVYQETLTGGSWTVSVLVEDTQRIGLEAAFFILLGLIMGLMAVVSLILSKKINQTLSPINNIIESIDEIKNGNYDVKIKVNENNELKYVADALNLMSKEIGKQVNLVYETYVFDQLTGLKNRKAVHSDIDEALFNGTDKVAVCLLDIDNFKSINVTKGQNIADELLKSIASRLKMTLRYKEYVYFNSGNEFVFIVPKVKQLETVESEILRVIENFQDPLEVKNIKVDVKVHIGVSIYPSDGKNMTELMKKCDTALYKAKESQSVKFVFYNDQLTREVNYRAQINEELSLALGRNQLYLKYQPLIDSRNEIYGFEALVRWKSPTLGEISPQIFIANAEESHMIIPIGTWILREACRTQVKLKAQFGKSFVMSINVSPVQIIQKDFIDVLKRVIRETEIDPQDLVLEITEGVLIESTIYLEETINFLHNIGARIALDDFGTGYASLTYLRKIPFDNLKIDKSFVDGIFAGKKDHSIIGTIVDMVHNLDMKVVAEGVETRKQYEYLKQISTDIFQGFLFSKALELDELKKYIDQFYKVAKAKRIDVFAAKDYAE